MKTRLYACSIIVLAVGLCGAVFIYLTAEDAAVSGASYIVVDGVSYEVDPGYSKAYARELERFGGKAAVLFDEISRWFGRLWQGRALAITVASISILVSLGLVLIARELPPDPRSGEQGEGDRGEA